VLTAVVQSYGNFLEQVALETLILKKYKKKKRKRKKKAMIVLIKVNVSESFIITLNYLFRAMYNTVN